MNRQDACIVINGNDTPDLKLNTQQMTPIIIEDSGDACICVNGKEHGKDGKDATINGVNTLTLTAKGLVSLTQVGSVATITSSTFIFEQAVSSSVWNIFHNLNKYPSVSVVDSSGNEIICEVVYNDLNNITIYTRAAFKGKAYLN